MVEHARKSQFRLLTNLNLVTATQLPAAGHSWCPRVGRSATPRQSRGDSHWSVQGPLDESVRVGMVGMKERRSATGSYDIPSEQF